MRIVGVFTVCVLALGSAAWSQGVGGASLTETTHLLRGRYQGSWATEWEVHVGLTDDRVGIELDPAGPSWLKHFQRDGAPGSLFPQHLIYLHEHLVISGERSWTGWIQQIDATDFAWALAYPFPNTMILANGVVPSGLAIEAEGASLRFSFDPLPPGTQIDIFAGLIYGNANLVDSFDVRQFPTPEPATMILIGAATAMWATRRRNSRVTNVSNRSRVVA